jgi:hypothetical protein
MKSAKSALGAMAKVGEAPTKARAKAPGSARERPPSAGATVTTLSSRHLTRTQAVRVTGIPKTTIRRAQEDGELPTVMGPGGEHLIEESALRLFAQKYAQRSAKRGAAGGESARGALASQAFERFDQKDNPVDVVKAFSYDPDTTEKLHAQWARLRGLLLLAPELVDGFVRELGAALGVAAPTEPIRTPDAFEAWSKDAIERAKKQRAAASAICTTCKRVAPTTCDACTKDKKFEERVRVEKVRADERLHREEMRLSDKRMRDDSERQERRQREAFGYDDGLPR